MKNLLYPARALTGALSGYLLAALADPVGPVQIAGSGLPADTLLVEERSAVLCFTCVAPPMFRSKLRRLAAEQAIDVVLVRCCKTPLDVLPASVDVSLGGGGLVPFNMYDLAIYRHTDGVLWLVPDLFGAAVRIGAEGFEVCLVPPYETSAERAGGVYRATAEMATLLYPQVRS